MLSKGALTSEKTSQLEAMRTQLGISKEAGDKAVRKAKSEVGAGWNGWGRKGKGGATL
jgi:hypothetical protein